MQASLDIAHAPSMQHHAGSLSEEESLTTCVGSESWTKQVQELSCAAYPCIQWSHEGKRCLTAATPVGSFSNLLARLELRGSAAMCPAAERIGPESAWATPTADFPQGSGQVSLMRDFAVGTVPCLSLTPATPFLRFRCVLRAECAWHMAGLTCVQDYPSEVPSLPPAKPVDARQKTCLHVASFAGLSLAWHWKLPPLCMARPLSLRLLHSSYNLLISAGL